MKRLKGIILFIFISDICSIQSMDGKMGQSRRQAPKLPLVALAQIRESLDEALETVHFEVLNRENQQAIASLKRAAIALGDAPLEIEKGVCSFTKKQLSLILLCSVSFAVAGALITYVIIKQ